jgi:hypothetical protein
MGAITLHQERDQPIVARRHRAYTASDRAAYRFLAARELRLRVPRRSVRSVAWCSNEPCAARGAPTATPAVFTEEATALARCDRSELAAVVGGLLVDLALLMRISPIAPALPSSHPRCLIGLLFPAGLSPPQRRT